MTQQPHRRGDNDPFLESPLGRFVRRHKLHDALYDGGIAFGTLARRCLAIRARAVDDVRECPSGSGREVPAEAARRLAEEIARIEKPLRALSPIGYGAVHAMCVFEREPAPQSEGEAIGVLHGLGRLMGTLR